MAAQFRGEGPAGPYRLPLRCRSFRRAHRTCQRAVSLRRHTPRSACRWPSCSPWNCARPRKVGRSPSISGWCSRPWPSWECWRSVTSSNAWKASPQSPMDCCRCCPLGRGQRADERLPCQGLGPGSWLVRLVPTACWRCGKRACSAWPCCMSRSGTATAVASGRQRLRLGSRGHSRWTTLCLAGGDPGLSHLGA